MSNQIKPTRDLRSQTLDLLRFPLAVVVLTIHVFSTTDIKMQGESYNMLSNPFFIHIDNFITAFLRSQSVPIYFFISGFVFFVGIDKFSKTIYFKKIKNRLKTLFVPYLFWNCMMIFLMGVRFLPIFDSFRTYTDTTFNLTIKTFLECFWVYEGSMFPYPEGTAESGNFEGAVHPIDGPLWFVRNLMIIMLFTPLIYLIIKRIGAFSLLALGLVWLFFQQYDPLGFSVGAFFFSCGAYMSINKKDMLEEFGKLSKLSFILYPLIGLACLYLLYNRSYNILYLKNVNIIIGLFFAYNLGAFLLKNNYCKVNKFLASASFFIYVSHALAASRVTKILFTLIKPNSDLGLLFVYIASVVATVLLLLLVFFLLKRFTPNLLNLIAATNKPRK